MQRARAIPVAYLASGSCQTAQELNTNQSINQSINQSVNTLLPPNEGQLANPKHVEV
jgi:hypothetical protein